MKTKIWIIPILAFFVGIISYASDTPKMNIVPLEAQKALVAFQSPNPTAIEITVTNGAGDILYYKKGENKLKEYRSLLNFSQLGQGHFNICINYDLFSLNRNVQVTKKGIKVGSAEKLYEPYFFITDGNLNISFLNLAQKNVHLEVLKNGRSISNSNLGKKMSIQKVIDLSKSGKGDYEIILSDLFRDHRFFVQL